MIDNPDRFVGTLMVVGSLGWLTIATTRYSLRVHRENQASKRLAAMRNHPAGKGDARLAWIDAAVDQALIDGLRAVEDVAIPKPRNPSVWEFDMTAEIAAEVAAENAEVARLRAELDDPTLVRIWMSS